MKREFQVRFCERLGVRFPRATHPKRSSNCEYAHFLNIAEASLAEAEYFILHLAHDLGYTSSEATNPIASEIADIARMLHALRSKVEQEP